MIIPREMFTSYTNRISGILIPTKRKPECCLCSNNIAVIFGSLTSMESNLLVLRPLLMYSWILHVFRVIGPGDRLGILDGSQCVQLGVVGQL